MTDITLRQLCFLGRPETCVVWKPTVQRRASSEQAWQRNWRNDNFAFLSSFEDALRVPSVQQSSFEQHKESGKPLPAAVPSSFSHALSSAQVLKMHLQSELID